MNERAASVERKTGETEIGLSLNLDGAGTYNINTGIPFFNHLLELFSKHARFDLEIRADGDIEVDFHHLVEDTGITLGNAFRKAIGDKGGIKRFAWALIPMDDALLRVCVDLSGRSFLFYQVPLKDPLVIHFNANLVEDFFRAFAFNAGITLHVDKLRGENAHHVVEAAFKALGVALHEASEVIFPEEDIPSTKGVL